MPDGFLAIAAICRPRGATCWVLQVGLSFKLICHSAVEPRVTGRTKLARRKRGSYSYHINQTTVTLTQPLSPAGDREVWPKMEYRSRLPGEPSLDHPGVPTGRLGHRAGLKTVGGIFRRFFCGLPALPRMCSDRGGGASSTGKCRSPQPAPRLRRPYGWSIEPIWSPHAGKGVLEMPFALWRRHTVRTPFLTPL